MYPDNVGCFVLDGMTNPDNWVSGQVVESVRTFDSILSHFLEFCHLAGPSKCSFATGNSTNDIFQRFETLLWQLDPPKVRANNWINGSDISTSLDTLQQIVNAQASNPFTGFPLIADALVAWEERDTSEFLRCEYGSCSSEHIP